MKNNRGQLGNLQGIILTLVIVGVLVAAGFFILAEFLDQTDTSDTFSVFAESGGFANSSGYQLSRNTHPGFSSPTITWAQNTTSTSAIELANFTVIANGTVTNATSISWHAVTFNYTFVGAGAAFDGVNKSINALDVIPDLLPLVVLIAMIVIILALVFTIPGARRA